MKKNIAFILAASMLFGVSACGNTNSESTPNQPEQQEQEYTNNKESQNDNTIDEEKNTFANADYDITGDEFIEKMNDFLKGINEKYKLENFQISSNTETTTTYSAKDGNILIEYSINKDSKKVSFFAVGVLDEHVRDITKEEAAKMFSYYSSAITILDKKVDIETLNEKLLLSDYTTPHIISYESEKTYFSTMVSDEHISMLLVAQNKKSEVKEEKVISEFDITGDEFIDIMNKLLEGTHPELVLENFKTTEVAEGNKIMYYAEKNNIFVSYTINKDTNNVYLFDVTIKNDILNKDTYANVLFYFMTAMSTLHLEEDTDDLLENLNMADYTSKNNEFYPTDEANYAKAFIDDDFTFVIQAPSNKE